MQNNMFQIKASLLPVLTLSVLPCLLSSQSAAAADKVSARTVETPSTRTTSIASSEIPEIEIPKSTFVADFNDRTARDPFFPNAAYVKPKQVAPVTPDTKVSGGETSLDTLKLTGMGGVGDKRWAMINGITHYLGESSKIRINGRVVSIEILEMDETSTTVGVVGTSSRRQMKLD
jgi:hypothetical protein